MGPHEHRGSSCISNSLQRIKFKLVCFHFYMPATLIVEESHSHHHDHDASVSNCQFARYLSIVTFSSLVICAAGSPSTVTKVLSTGKRVSLDCIVTQDSNLDIYWSRSDGQGTTFIAHAGRLSERGSFYSNFNNERFTLNYTRVWNITTSVFTLTIWNITSEDSSTYHCNTNNYNTSQNLIVYSCDVKVVDCSCSMDRKVRCILTGFYTDEWISVNLRINEIDIGRPHIRPPNEIITYNVDLEQNRDDVEIQVSSVQNGEPEIDVLCILPALVQTSIPSSPTQSSPSSSTQSRTTLGKTAAAVATSPPTDRTLSSSAKITPSTIAEETTTEKSTARVTTPSPQSKDISTLHSPVSLLVTDYNNKSKEDTVSTATSKISTPSTSSAPKTIPRKTMQTTSWSLVDDGMVRLTASFTVSPDYKPTYTDPAISNFEVSGKHDSSEFLIIIVSVVSCSVILLSVVIIVLYRKKKRSPKQRPAPGISDLNLNRQNAADTNVEMNSHPISTPCLRHDCNMTSDESDRICHEKLVDNALYESSEINQPDDLRPSASHMNKEIHGPSSSNYQDQDISFGEQAYSVVNKDLRGEQFLENELYVSSEIKQRDDLRLSASHTNKEMQGPASKIDQDERTVWGENAYSTVNKTCPKEQFVENVLYESSDGILGSLEPAKEELAYSEITM